MNAWLTAQLDDFNAQRTLRDKERTSTWEIISLKAPNLKISIQNVPKDDTLYVYKTKGIDLSPLMKPVKISERGLVVSSISRDPDLNECHTVEGNTIVSPKSVTFTCNCNRKRKR